VKPIQWLKALVFILCLIPLGRLVEKGIAGNLGANPIEVITHSTGLWTLTFLLITLGITPLRQLAGVPELVRFRRMIGLFAFFYATLHLLTYVWLDQFFDVRHMVNDIVRRPFITAGFAGFVLLIPLAITSTRKMIQRLGGKRWQGLHRLIYVSAAAGALHFLWLVKRDRTQPSIYAAVLAALLAYRVVAWLRQQESRKPAQTIGHRVIGVSGDQNIG